MSERRVLVADDNEDIRRDVARVLGGGGRRASLAERAARLLPGLGLERLVAPGLVVFSVDPAASGEEALALARAARARGEPYAVGFVDVRMPPGIDGARVGRILRAEDPDMEVVLITAYADRTVSELNAGDADADRLIFLKKPYAPEEVYQLALSLSEKRIQRRSLRAARARVELVLRATSDGLLGIDSDHRVVFANPAASALLRLPEPPAGDAPWSALAALGARRVPGSAAIEVRLAGRWLELGEVARPEPGEGPGPGAVRGVLAVRDVTARKEIERLKDEFVQNTSHELRTPLVALRGYLDLALEERLGPLAAPLRKGLEVARRASGRLLDLIDALLELARLEALGPDAATFERVRVPELVQRTAELLRPAADAKKLSLAIDVEGDCPDALGDPRTLDVALRNLLGNAIKFTDKGEVGIRARRAPRERVLLEVWDTGPGLPSGVEPVKLFERFRQGDGSISRAKGGVGIGLSLVERILALHGRPVTARDRPGGGASFSFELDQARAEPTVPIRGAGPLAGAVLVLDRSPATRDFLAFVLSAAGHVVRTAASVAEANPGGLPLEAAFVEGEPAAIAVRERLGPRRIAVLAAPGESPSLAFETLAKPVTLARVLALAATSSPRESELAA